jgi:hypothetical protein
MIYIILALIFRRRRPLGYATPTRPLPVLGGRQMTTLVAIIPLMVLGSIRAHSPQTPLPSSAGMCRAPGFR